MSRRHLAFAVVEYLRRLSRRDDAADIDMAEVKAAKESIKKAFKLPDDDSLKVKTQILVARVCCS